MNARPCSRALLERAENGIRKNTGWSRPRRPRLGRDATEMWSAVRGDIFQG